MRKCAALVLLAALTAACGEKAAHVSATPSAPATASGGVAVTQVLIATAVTPPSGPGTLNLFSPSGTRVAHFTLEADTRVLAASGSRVFIQHVIDHLKAHC